VVAAEAVSWVAQVAAILEEELWAVVERAMAAAASAAAVAAAAVTGLGMAALASVAAVASVAVLASPAGLEGGWAATGESR